MSLLWTLVIFCLQIRKAGCVNCNTKPYSTVINGNCFWLIKTQQDMLSSQDICTSQGGYLAVITDSSTIETLDTFTDAENMNYDLKFVGYSVDSSTSNYVLRRMNGQIQSYKPFSSFSVYGPPYDCVVLHHDVFHPRKCTDSFYALCSDIVNIDPSLLPTSPPPLPTTTSEMSTAQTTTVTEPTTTLEVTTQTEAVTTQTEAVTTQTEAVTTSTSTQNPLTSTPCDCNSFCNNNYVIQPVNMTDELIEKLNELTRILSVEKKELSLAIRRKISASDDRVSAAGLGAIGITVLVIIFGGIALFDLIPAFKMLYTKLTSKSYP